ncbi:hypothetical protein LZ31DRAFT_125545 [Colletotrichum somersetense]|nr:hypothetical protein LZ31DRAFT_125545 [Colletotrichum somersetense]
MVQEFWRGDRGTCLFAIVRSAGTLFLSFAYPTAFVLSLRILERRQGPSLQREGGKGRSRSHFIIGGVWDCYFFFLATLTSANIFY